ncbi:hypothetical protein N7E81_07950 [Reichenbachiella carrageenanivorans]|uniref:Sortilin N-terminal domain-containing protein n=1 Tax=Reichenbachiella carrageenanivorans TaxID=2979869 RepID=A0ABY6D603_9BACT|nr:hypothetical protein [Reichenbachiella carrageenanivorans]UXX81030.1 hypothetical protein N7E81_07950 [Reichenbachiella carrageenanivorans]
MMKRVTNFLILMAWFSIIHYNASAQWFNANPGHGGQVQHVVCDPNEDGKMYLCSDMEGYYVSHDYGDSWESYSFQSLYSNVFNIAIAPTNSDRLLMGSTYGAAKSDDGGDTWSFVNELKGKPVSAMAIDPSDEDYMYMAPSWLEDKVNAFATSGERSLYYSHNSGDTWTKSNYVAGSAARNVYTITIHPTNGDVWLGSESGLFRSTDHGVTWTAISKPTNAKTCLGADITPDGAWVYAAYERNDGNSGLYVRAYDDGDWSELDASGVMQAKNQLHWRPVVDPNSTATNHFVMLGTLFRGGNGNENALLEGRFTVSGGVTITGTIQEAFKYTGVESIEEIGWNKYQGVSRTYAYYPKSWTNYSYTRGAFIMSQQSAYIGDLTDASSWKCVTSHQEKNLNGVDFYRTNGTASTFNWDMDGYENYVVQAMADNGIVESYDGGFSWSQPSIVMTGSWNADAAESVVKSGENTIMLAGTADGFGGALAEWSGRLLYKELTNLSGPVDSWQVLIDGKSGTTKGLGTNNRITFIHSDDNIPERVYISTIGGAYVTENIHELVAGNSTYNFVKITSGDTEVPGRKIMSDPNDSDLVYLRCTNGTFKGQRQSGGNYIWTELSVNGSTNGLDSNWGSNGDMTVWANGSTTYLLLTKGDNSNVNYELHLSADGGDNFTQVVTRADAETLRNPAWLGAHGFKTSFGGICGLNNQFFFTFQVRENGEKLTKGIAFIKANIGNSLADITLEDWTGTVGENYMEFPVSRRGKIWSDDQGNAHIYQATMGTGLWKRSLKKKEAPTAVFSSDKKEVSVSWYCEF